MILSFLTCEYLPIFYFFSPHAQNPAIVIKMRRKIVILKDGGLTILWTNKKLLEYLLAKPIFISGFKCNSWDYIKNVKNIQIELIEVSVY